MAAFPENCSFLRPLFPHITAPFTLPHLFNSLPPLTSSLVIKVELHNSENSSTISTRAPVASCLASPMYLPISARRGSTRAKTRTAAPIYTYANHPGTIATTIHNQLFNQFDRHKTFSLTKLKANNHTLLLLIINAFSKLLLLGES